jgi:tetratricopeptide (TPR) repeat protein
MLTRFYVYFVIACLFWSCQRDKDSRKEASLCDEKKSPEALSKWSIQDLYDLSNVSEKLLDHDTAIFFLNEIIKRDSLDGAAYYNRALCYAAKLFTDKSNEDFYRAINLGYEIDRCYLNIGLNYIGEENYDSAELFFRKVLDINPSQKDAKAFLKIVALNKKSV